MPSLNDSRKIIKTSIHGIDGSEVELWDTLTVGDSERVQLIEDNMGKGIEALLCLIKWWNLDDPINSESIRKLNTTQFEKLIEQTAFYQEGKKKAEQLEDEKVEKKTR